MVERYIKRDGDIPFRAPQSMGGFILRDLPAPTLPTDAVNKEYVDSKIGGSGNSSVFRAAFLAADWTAGTANRIKVIRTGTPGAGEIGPHGLAASYTYTVQVYEDGVTSKLVDLGTEVDVATGDITLSKTGLATAFNGHIIIIGT